MSEWQQIETAPKDGTMILVWDESASPEVVAAYFLDEWWIYGDQLLAEADPEGPSPTHWMPLPPPPMFPPSEGENKDAGESGGK